MKHLLFILFFLSTVTFGQENLIAETERQLKLDLIIDTTSACTWELVEYELIDDTSITNNFVRLLAVEYGKYPPNYFENIGIRKIMLCKNLKYDRVVRAGIPDPYTNTVFLDANSNYFGYTQDYFIHTMHHELHHCAEVKLWGDMYYKSEEWASLNRKSFEYGNGGASTYLGENLAVDWYSMFHPEKGFANLYSMTGQEEDRCELVAFIMNDRQRKILLEYCEKDKIIRAKTLKIMSYLNQLSGVTEAFWNTEMSAIIKA